MKGSHRTVELMTAPDMVIYAFVKDDCGGWKRGEERGKEGGEGREGYVVVCLLDKNSGIHISACEGLATIHKVE